jgi:hypothetical protein
MSAGDQSSAGEGGLAAQRGDRKFLKISILIFTALTVLFFWRYAWSPTTTVSDPGDPLFLMWTMEWVRRALVHSPSQLFDAPMFHPLPDVLAYSDPLLPQAIVGAPLRLVGFGPIFAYNAVYLGGIALSGVLTAHLFLRLTGDRTAALVGAVVATYPALRLFHLAHMQMQVTTFLPLVFLLVHRVVERPGAGNAAALGAAVVATALASLYYGFFLAVFLPFFALSVWLVSKERGARALVALAGAAALSGLALLPVARVYTRAIGHLALPRPDKGFCDLRDFFALHGFADVSRWAPSLVIHDSGPQWLGGGAALLLPVAALGIGAAAIRRFRRRASFPEWARTLLPYAVLGCLALALAVGPEVRFRGRLLSKNPFGYIARLPGAREIRDYQRVGFIVALAGGALIAVALAEFRRRRKGRHFGLALSFVGVTTVAPAFSSSLPEYRPPARVALDPAYRWIEAQPSPFVFFETPLPDRGEREALDYVWAAIFHKKPMIHGFSGYLPLSDGMLRGEELGVDRPDFFRTLGLMGATHLLVHTKRLVAHEGGAAALARLRDAFGGNRVARFPDSEVYTVDPAPVPFAPAPAGRDERAAFSSGGWFDARDCVETGTTAPPLLLYAPKVVRVQGIRFLPESSFTELDDSLRIEVSDDLRTWRTAPHRPLLSSAMAAYLAHPTPELWMNTAISPETGPFLRLSSRRGLRLRLCMLSIDSPKVRAIDFVPRKAMRVAASVSEGSTGDVVDGNPDTRWTSQALQRGDEWIEVTFDRERDVVAVLLDLGKNAYDFGRRLAVDCIEPAGSTVFGLDVDGAGALFERPRPTQVLPLTPPRSCRALRIRQIGRAESNYWSIAEIAVLEPSG